MYHCCSGASGYLLPLSGGADSSSTAAIVGAMAQMVVNAAAGGDPQALADARRCVFKDRDVRPSYAFVHAALMSRLALAEMLLRRTLAPAHGSLCAACLCVCFRSPYFGWVHSRGEVQLYCKCACIRTDLALESDASQGRAVCRRRGAGQCRGAAAPHLHHRVHGDGEQLARDAAAGGHPGRTGVHLLTCCSLVMQRTLRIAASRWQKRERVCKQREDIVRPATQAAALLHPVLRS